MLDFLKNEGVSPKIISEIEAFRAKYPTVGNLSKRVPVPRYLYYGKDVCHGHEGGDTCHDLGLYIGVIFLQMKDIF